MDIDNIEKKLKKIQTVLEIFKEDGRLSKIEIDLLKGYISNLYDSVCFAEEGLTKYNEAHKAVTTVKNDELPAIIKEANQQKLGSDIQNEDITPKIIEEKIEEKTADTPIKIEFNTGEYQKESIAEMIPDIEIKSESNIEPSIKIETPVQIISANPPIIGDLTNYLELAELFSDEEYTDISDKLSMKKIDQIATSIGINDRFFMINELFNGDGTLFSKILEKLDKVGNLEDAKSIVLNEVAIPMKWVENNKLNSAEDFVKLIKRKYK